MTKKKLTTLLLVFSVLSAILSVISRIYLTYTKLDSEFGVYQRGATIVTVYHIILVLVCIAILVVALAFTKNVSRDYFPSTSAGTTFTASVTAFLLLASLFISLYYIVVQKSPVLAFDAVELLISFPTIIFFLRAGVSKTKNSVLTAFLSFCPILWSTVCVIRVYFDSSILMTSPNRIMNQIAFIAAMLYFLTESRIHLGISNNRFHVATAAVTPILLLTSAVPNLVCAKLLSIGESDSFMKYAVQAAMALFIYCRLFSYGKNKE